MCRYDIYDAVICFIFRFVKGKNHRCEISGEESGAHISIPTHSINLFIILVLSPVPMAFKRHSNKRVQHLCHAYAFFSHDNSKPAAASMAYRSFSRSISLLVYFGNLSKFIQVELVGKRMYPALDSSDNSIPPSSSRSRICWMHGAGTMEAKPSSG